MVRIIKKYIAVILFLQGLLSIYSVNAQFSLSTPYSRYGMGSLFSGANNAGVAIGGVGYARAKNNEVNFSNAASYSAVDTQSFIFNIGFNTQWHKIHNNEAESKAYVAGISNISFSFPLFRRLKMGISLAPFSSVDYSASDTILGDINYLKKYTGEGNIDRVIVGLAYQPLKSGNNNLSIGFNGIYYFGSVNRLVDLKFLNTVPDTRGLLHDTTGFFNTYTKNEYNVSSLGFEIGLQYFHVTGDKVMGIGLNFQPSYKLGTDNKRMFYTYYTSSSSDNVQDTVQYSKSKGNITMPMKIGGGVSFEKVNKFFVEADMTYTQWSKFLFEQGTEDAVCDNLLLNFGFEYTPNVYGLSYFEKLAYRAGFGYDNGYIALQGQRIDKFYITAGVALPIKKAGTLLNINFEYGTIGTTDNNLIKENYFSLGLSVSAKDRWFVKRKYQ